MNSDHLTDSLGRQWVFGPVLGRGTWGRSRLVRDVEGREMVLKEPLTEADFSSDAPLHGSVGLTELLDGCRHAARLQAGLLENGTYHYLPRLESTMDLGGGRLGLVLPRYHTLERRLEMGVSLGDLLRLVYRIALTLAETQTVHGNLKPSNIVFGERGEAFLTDPTARLHHGGVGVAGLRLLELSGSSAWLPPEMRSRPSSKPNPSWDTWALCQLIYAVILLEPRDPERDAELRGLDRRDLDRRDLDRRDLERERELERRPTLPLASGGLDKVATGHLKEVLAARLASEGTNPRFRARVVDRLGALLARGLSPEHEPSPPFRFATARDFADRVNEVLALLRPRVVEVGKVLFPANAADGIFRHGSEISFSVTVGCTHGITDHDDLVCGLQLVDLDAPDPMAPEARKPVDDARLKLQVHPSGRLRFQLTIPELPPGRFRVRVAFAIKDSGDEPQVAVGDLEVRPPPGYIPPRQEHPAASPLPFRPGSGQRAHEPAEERPSQGPTPLHTHVQAHSPTAAPTRGPSAQTGRGMSRLPPSPASPSRNAGTPVPGAQPSQGARVTPLGARGSSSRSSAETADSGLQGLPPREVHSPANREGVVVGLFPRPVRPPDEEFEDDLTPPEGTPRPLRVVQPEQHEPSEAVLTSSPSTPSRIQGQPRHVQRAELQRSEGQRLDPARPEGSSAPPAAFRADTAFGREGAAPGAPQPGTVLAGSWDAASRRGAGPPNDTFRAVSLSPVDTSDLTQPAPDTWPPPAASSFAHRSSTTLPPLASPGPASVADATPEPAAVRGLQPLRSGQSRSLPPHDPGASGAHRGLSGGSLPGARPGGLEDDKTRPGLPPASAGHDDLPAAGDDLPGIVGLPRPGRSLPAPLVQLVDLVRSDTYVALGAAIAASLMLLLVTTAVLKAC